MTKTPLRSGRNDKRASLGSAAEKHTFCPPRNGHLFLPYMGSESGHVLPEKIDGLRGARVEIAAVAALLRNDIVGPSSFACILGIRSGARNDIDRCQEQARWLWGNHFFDIQGAYRL